MPNPIPRRRACGINVIAFARLIDVLNSTVLGLTREELAAEIGVTTGTLGRWLRLLQRHVYIISWRPAGRAGPPTARWGWGLPAFSAPMPRPKTNAEHSRAHRQRRALLADRATTTA